MLLKAGPRLHASKTTHAGASADAGLWLAFDAASHPQEIIIRLGNALSGFVMEIHIAGGYRA